MIAQRDKIYGDLSLMDICEHYTTSRNIKKWEETKEILKKIEKYKKRGCYRCGGNNRTCDAYYSPLESYNKGFDAGIHLIDKKNIK